MVFDPSAPINVIITLVLIPVHLTGGGLCAWLGTKLFKQRWAKITAAIVGFLVGVATTAALIATLIFAGCVMLLNNS